MSMTLLSFEFIPTRLTTSFGRAAASAYPVLYTLARSLLKLSVTWSLTSTAGVRRLMIFASRTRRKGLVASAAKVLALPADAQDHPSSKQVLPQGPIQ
jgi:hypothetical protein